MKYLSLLLVVCLLSGSGHSQTGGSNNKTYPQYKDGDYEFRTMLLDNFLNLPDVAYDSCLQGTVVVSFTVRQDGSLDSFITLHSVHPALDQHAYVFLYKTNNKWIPGTIDGKPVNMRKTIPFVYGSFNEKTDSKNYNLAQISMLRTIVGNYLNCPQAHDYYKAGLKKYKEAAYEEAHVFFDKANRRDFLHLDAIDMLKKTSDRLGKDCDVCGKLSLLSKYSHREIKRVRDKYCTKDFKPLNNN